MILWGVAFFGTAPAVFDFAGVLRAGAFAAGLFTCAWPEEGVAGSLADPGAATWALGVARGARGFPVDDPADDVRAGVFFAPEAPAPAVVVFAGLFGEPGVAFFFAAGADRGFADDSGSVVGNAFALDSPDPDA
ncbi:hypothetical protein [Mycetocola zhadangensis]|uniref:Uncharacterized protein n=1 Tax=Mycetocola zhadangensis TaxID=1164595 RepID=A0A3L7J5X0_9MICO|nr:hypothetical protein [Mycetocola zhadangensis]RLQ85755.1 hypothetical protein D9V28_02510 [Mycetocola zhadangensis]GGE85517.1 hypothetical protein GCM10011313_04960 [Mycetocola zhadangensis]